MGDRKDVMISSAHPYCSIVFQLFTAFTYPCPIEGIHVFRSPPFVPLPLIHAHDFPTLHAYSPIAQEIRRVSKYHVELEIELFQQFDTVAVKKGESMSGRKE